MDGLRPEAYLSEIQSDSSPHPHVPSMACATENFDIVELVLQGWGTQDKRSHRPDSLVPSRAGSRIPSYRNMGTGKSKTKVGEERLGVG